MSDTQQYWSKKIAKYTTEPWAELPSIFLEEIAEHLPASGKVLELGCGVGNDGLWLATKGFDVTQTDLGDYRRAEAKQLPFIELDMHQPLQVEQTFDVVYAHLSLHYFSSERTVVLFEEIKNLLNPNGILAFIVNSKDDPEYIDSNKNDDYIEVDGEGKRFFDVESALKYCEGMEVLLADNKGTVHKDNAKGVKGLIRIVCRKKS